MSSKSSVFLFVIFLSSLFMACQEKVELPPVPVAKMSKILVDLQFSESYSIGLGLDSLSGANQFKKNQDSLSVFYASVFKHHQLTLEQFNEAMDWYRNRPQKMDSLMVVSLQEFEQQKTKFNIPEFNGESTQEKNEEEKTEKKDPSFLKDKLEERKKDMNLEAE